MDKELEQKLNNFVRQSEENKSLWYNLRNWIEIKNKPFGAKSALACIYEYADGDTAVIKDILRQFRDNKKTKSYGRARAAYADAAITWIDIVINSDGQLELKGYSPDRVLQLKGQHRSVDNSKIYKNDGTVNKNYQKSEEKMYNLGYLVRNLYPNEDNIFITHAMQAIKKYANNAKKTPESVVRRIRLKRLYYDPTDEQIKPTNGIKSEGIERKVIVVTESMADILKKEIEMTEYKFQVGIKKFLHDLLVDPVNAQVPDVFRYYDYNRSRLISLLRSNDLLRKSERISDKDEFGNDKTATMQVKYRVPKKNFDRKIRNLYIKMFERNIPSPSYEDTELSEDSGAAMCGATSADSSGQFSQPVFPLQRRTMYGNNEIEEGTTTSSVGDYQYDVPFVGDKETLSRKNGKGGSTSVQIAENDNVNEYLDNNMLNVRKNIKNAVDDYGYNWAEEPYDKKEIVKNEWMLHFSETKNASNIATNGFKKANDFTKSPEQVTYQKSKSENGFNYAYLATDVLQYWKDGGQSMGIQPFLDYLMNERRDNFVMFKGNGFRFYHDGDGEEQVVFNNIQPGTKVLVMYINGKYCVMNNANPELMHRKNPLQKSEGGLNSKQWSNPKNTMSNILYFSAEIEKVIEWVMTNYEQYKKSLEYNKTN